MSDVHNTIFPHYSLLDGISNSTWSVNNNTAAEKWVFVEFVKIETLLQFTYLVQFLLEVDSTHIPGVVTTRLASRMRRSQDTCNPLKPIDTIYFTNQ